MVIRPKRVYLLMAVMISRTQSLRESFPFYYRNYQRRTLNLVNVDFHLLPNLKVVRKMELLE